MLSWWVNTSSCSIAHFMNTILFCSTDLGAIKHIFNGVLNFRYLYRLVKYRGYGDSGVRLVPSSRVARNTSRPFEIFTAIIIAQNLQLS